MPEPHRRLGRRSIELGGRWQAAEPRLVESLTTQPRARREASRAHADRRQELLDAPERPAVEMRFSGGERQQVQMRVDDPGQQRRTPAVEAADGASCGAPDVSRPPDCQHAAAAHGDGARTRCGGVQRHDPRVLENAGLVRQSDDGSGFASLSFIS